MILVNGIQTDRVSVTDRGLLYGDGLFETIAVRKQNAQLLDAHLSRLAKGCEALSISFDDWQALRDDIETLSQTVADQAILKIIITRGSGSRGYRSDNDISATRIISLHPWGEHIATNQKTGIQLGLCQTRLSHNPSLPQLVGVKHLNRLEQVMASAELSKDIAEGLMLSSDAQPFEVVEGTMSNVFIITSDGAVKTPVINRCGIQGIMRQVLLTWLLKNNVETIETALSLDDVRDAKSILMTNSIIGIWPVSSFESNSYTIPEFVDSFNHYLRSELR